MKNSLKPAAKTARVAVAAAAKTALCAAFLALLPALFAGCFSRDGISTEYYDDCEEYYDAAGVYQRFCPGQIRKFNNRTIQK